MPKIYKITGDFEQKSEWVKPGFEGYFVQYDSTTIKGYVNEQYECWGYSTLRFIVGRYDDQTGELGFIKLSNESDLDTLIYIFKDARKEGVWACISLKPVMFWIRGRANVNISETDEVTEEQILSRFNYMNLRLLDHTAICECFGNAEGMKELVSEKLCEIIDRWLKH